VRGFRQAGGEMLDIGFQAFGIRRPIFKPHQHDVHTVAVRGQRARRVEQELEYLVVGRHPDAIVETQLAHPKGEGGFDSIRGEGGADDDGRAGHRIHHHYRGRRNCRTV
jgi:hypothetical protein